MAQPDGFSKPRAPPVAKSSIPKFASAFGTPPPVKRPLKAKDAPRPPKPLDSASETRSTTKTKPPLRALKPPVPLFDSGRSKHADEPLPVPPRMPPPPIFPPVAAPKIPALRQLAAPPPPPPPVASSSKATAALKPLVPPPHPAFGAQPGSADRNMRTISTTLLARATDMLTEHGQSELASILLHDQYPDIPSMDDVDENRGVMVSPEKSSKGKEKFARNGLAARAAALYERSYSSLALWEAEMAHSLSSSSRRSLGLNPDMRLRIIHVLHIPTPISQPSSKASIPGVALCHIISAPAGSDSSGPSLPQSKDGICAVLFSFSSLSPPARPHAAAAQWDVRNPEDFAQGREVYVWKPWQKLVITVPAITKMCLVDSAAADAGEAEAEAEADPAFELFESGAAGALRRGTISETALVCERFVVLK
ncbi:hypothetical protein FB45DRAFT_180613 [Roridomyces roridus]|uniref:Uncharacterized protein n=1 Tax=Roridomyces roridus TaxID=1738132 RepID=A0AAD7FW20_9AGAR|nr:hypothetical protein FB45DRAFT_180613 [Roridomyces roridus]